jgi:PAS domain S-box-containing protein
MHSDRRTFDAEDDRVMGSLGKVAAATYQALACIDDLKIEIVEHEKAEAEASELARGLEAQAQRQYQTVVETATDAVVTIDATSAIRLVNPAVTKVFGYEPAEVIGKPLTVLMPARLANRHLTGLQRYVETGHRRLNWSAIELIGLRKNGEEFPVEISFAEVINDGQRTFTGFIRDITERKQAEELRAARTRQVAVRADVSSALATDDTLRGTLESCAEAVVKHLGAAFARIWVVTKDGRFLELQASAGMYTHLDGAHRLVPVGHLKIGLIALERTPHVTNDVINDPRLSNPDWAGAEGMVGFAGFPLLAGGQVVGVLAMFSREPISQAVIETLASISDTIAQGIQRKQAANALLKAQSELAEMTRLTTMGELAASIAHEINQPLASVVTNAQACARLLRAQPPLWDDVMGAVSDIAEAGKRASDVIARIRLLLRKGVSEPLPLSVNDVIRDVIALTRDMTGQKRVMLDTRLTHDVPQVLADRVQLQQVLINLIANAAEAMSDVSDRPRRLTISSGCNDESQVEVAVVDAGVGIDPKHRDRVFDPFFTTKADGMGMGLAICRGIVDAHGGRLWATPNPEFGTTVRLALPAVETEDA